MSIGQFGEAKIMGIVNINDDSFYSMSRAASSDEFCRRTDYLLEKGASIIDIGAISSRPGAVPVSAEEEWRRLAPIVETAAKKYAGISFSIDTFRAGIVLLAYQEMGRFIINDISAGEWDEAMLPVAGRLRLRYVAMHHRGTFETMHDEWHYDDIVESVIDFFKQFSESAKEAGIADWILDPGFGFSKSAQENMTLLENLSKLKIFRKPILIGISHKRFTAGESALLEKKAVQQGASIVRTHL